MKTGRTMRQIAADACVSKMTIYRIVTREHIKGRYGNDRALHFDDTAEKAILAALGRDQAKSNRNSERNADTPRDTVPDTPNTDLVRALNDRIKSQQQQIEHLTRLLDQSQQLQLMAEQKVKQLEAPQNESEGAADDQGSQIHKDTQKAPTAVPNEPSERPGFWARLFGG